MWPWRREDAPVDPGSSPTTPRAPVRELVTELAVGLVFLTGAALFFLIFLRHFESVEDRGGVRRIVGILRSGKALRQADGTSVPVPAPPGTELMDGDELQISHEGGARLELASGRKLEIEAGSVVSFRQPFRPDLQDEEAHAARVLVGRATLEVAKGNVRTLSPLPSLNIGGGATGLAPPASGISPLPGATVAAPAGAATTEVLIGWGRSVHGFLVVVETRSASTDPLRATQIARTRFFPLADQAFSRPRLRAGMKYAWSLINETGQLLSGPFSFSIAGGR